MNEDVNKIIAANENGEEVEMDIIFSFYSKNANKNYVFLTDYTTDENGEPIVYAYYTSPDGQSLVPVTDAEELDTVNKIVEKYQDSKIEKEETETIE